jgi:hypothetical protein
MKISWPGVCAGGSHHDERENPVPDDADDKAGQNENENEFLHGYASLGV